MRSVILSIGIGYVHGKITAFAEQIAVCRYDRGIRIFRERERTSGFGKERQIDFVFLQDGVYINLECHRAGSVAVFGKGKIRAVLRKILTVCTYRTIRFRENGKIDFCKLLRRHRFFHSGSKKADIQAGIFHIDFSQGLISPCGEGLLKFHLRICRIGRVDLKDGCLRVLLCRDIGIAGRGSF